MAKSYSVNKQDVYEAQMKILKVSKVIKNHRSIYLPQHFFKCQALNYSLERKQWVRLLLPSSNDQSAVRNAKEEGQEYLASIDGHLAWRAPLKLLRYINPNLQDEQVSDLSLLTAVVKAVEHMSGLTEFGAWVRATERQLQGHLLTGT